jgi:hypothetical protein
VGFEKDIFAPKIPLTLVLSRKGRGNDVLMNRHENFSYKRFAICGKI